MKKNFKQILTEKDFDSISWHDSTIRAIAFSSKEYKLVFDIDYIMEWVDAKLPDGKYKFWIAPATLTFENVFNIKLDMQTDGFLPILDINRQNPQQQSEHAVTCLAGIAGTTGRGGFSPSVSRWLLSHLASAGIAVFDSVAAVQHSAKSTNFRKFHRRVCVKSY